MLIVCVCLYHTSAADLDIENHEVPTVYEASMIQFQRQQPPALPETVFRMLGERQTFIGGQLDDQELTRFLARNRVRHVIDLAHESAAEAILADRVERFIVEKNGGVYWSFNIEGRNNRLNQTALATIDSLMDSGEPVFVHCRHGQHRAKAVAGRAYARDGYRWETIVDLLSWEPVVKNSIYDRYTNDVWEQVARFNTPENARK